MGDLPWSRPFRTDEDGTLTVLMGDLSSPLLPRLLRIEIRSVLEEARFLVTFRRPPIHPPYRLENRTGKCVLEYRQGGLPDESKWAALDPHSAVAFVWEDKMQEEKRLEVRARLGGQLGEPQSYDLERLGRLDSLPVPGASTYWRLSLRYILYIS